ncbi:polymorphic toxin-type HINT domain-containing protein [Kitasatospora sp. NPDC090091]|uniref:polymorphic toxin-type HINT domain-containing protein n=1 Tax=Kitasatospora sp. NPDC090091 TaxID=3364081 RepID=UPI0037F5288C
MTGAIVPPAAAWTFPEPKGKVWTPPNTPLGDATASVEGHDIRPPGTDPVGKPAEWKPQPQTPVVTGTETVTVGPDGAEAKAARAATGGASPASGGLSGSKAGNLAVQVAPGSGKNESVRTVTVEVMGEEKGRAAGVATPLVALSDADDKSGADGRTASVTLDLKALRASGWSDRAAIISLPACALTTPERSECRTQTPLPSRLGSDGKTTVDVTLPPLAAPSGKGGQDGTVKASFTTAGAPASAAVGSAGAPLVLAASPSPSGAGGTYTATSLSPSAAWKAGTNVGNFSYGYPLQLPPSLGGTVPVVGLSYDSSVVDGKTSATNAQSSWIGDGWGYEPGYIERSYRACDKAGITGSGDQCWGGQNAVLALGAHSGVIVRDDATGTWHLQDDDGSKVEQLTGAPKAAGDADYRDMEYWRITTPDGTEYYFGRNHLPGGNGSDPAANSVLTSPVYSPKNGDPCYSPASGNGSWCQMAWRWQLDYVVDARGNLTTYNYATEGNQYSRGGGQNQGNGALTPYQRAGYLREIGYGQRLDEQKTANGGLNPAARVIFKTEERCKPSGAITCAEDQRTAANADAWPDVPIDQICAGTGSCTNYAPTYFTTKRLTAITSQVFVNSAYRDVDTWALSQSLADPGDGTKRTLRLDSIQRTGANGQSPSALPLVSFTYVMMANRVDGLVPAAPMFMRPRLQNITTETGGRINVHYTEPECSRVNNHMPAAEDDNSMACMPVKWYLPGQSSPDPVNDWFNKPLVRSVTEQDLVTVPSVGKTTEYAYNGGAAWHRNDAEFTYPKTRTWDQFRGYQSVTTTTGSGSVSEAPKTQQTVTYLRGMDGDYLANGTRRSVQVTNPLGGTVPDSDWLNGHTVATEGFDQAGGTVQAVSGNTYSGQTITATRAQSAGTPAIYARYSDSQTTAVTKTKLADGSWRTSTVVTTTDPAHGNRVIRVNDRGDGTAAAPELCTTTDYAVSSNPQVLTLVSEQTTIQDTCGNAPSPSNTVSGSRTLYDGKPFGQAGPTGYSTSALVLDGYDTAGKPVYALSGTTSYDVYGRTTSAATTDGSTYDAAGNQLTGGSVTPAVNTVTYTPGAGVLPTQTRTVGPMGSDWVTTTTQDPGRATPLTTTDVNGRVTTMRYDAFGRITGVWAPDRPISQNPSQRFSYALNGTTAPTSIMSESIQEGGQTYSAKVEILDGLGRPRQTQQTSDAKPTGRLITDTVYDSHGWVIKTSDPYYEKTTFPSGTVFAPAGDSQVPAQTWNTYDGQGRVIRAEFRSYANLQWATATAYPGADRVDVTPPAGATPTSTVTDARGRTVAAWQYRTATSTGNPADADVTTYRYTAAGAPAGHTDSAGNTWSYTYDLRGRRTTSSDPDAGTTKTFYDANSRIDHTVGAKGNTLAYSYDLLGRKTGQYNGSVAPANQLAGWTYDTLVKEHLTSSTRYVGGAGGAAYTTAVTSYDTAYRPRGTSVTIPTAEGALAGTYTTKNTYSAVLGSLKEMRIPAAGGLPAETIGYAYTDTGLPTTVDSNYTQQIVAQRDYDALGRVTRTTVGDYGSQVVSTQQYDWATGRVINSFLDRQNGTVSADQTSYTYTVSGRITSVTDLQDARDRDLQCFTYDHLGRLTNAWTDTGTTYTTADWTDSSGTVHGTGSSTTVPGIGGCTNGGGPAITGPGGRTVGGPAPYWNTYNYDASGNRTGLVQHDITGNTSKDTVTTQTFGANKSVNTPTGAPNTGGGTGGPHALLTSSTKTSGGTKAVGYQYDANGNTTAMTDTGGTTTLTWNGEDKLESLTKTGQAGATTYLYDADGNQLIRRNPGKTTLNLPTDELTLDTASGSMSNVRSVGASGGLTYTRVTAPIGGGTVLIQAADPHGTNGVQIGTDTAMTVTRRPTDPFGSPRGTQPAASAWAGTKGFVGGSKDDTTGLTNLGARQYEPTTGRFISPDPILDPASPQQWNGYAYSNNDPINGSDPTGLLCEGMFCGGHDAPWGPPVQAPSYLDNDSGTGYGAHDCRHDNSCPSLEDRTMRSFLRTAEMAQHQDVVRDAKSTTQAELSRVIRKYNSGTTTIDWAALQMWEYGATEEEADFFRAHYCLFIDCHLEGQITGHGASGDPLITPFGFSPMEKAANAVGSSFAGLAARGGRPGELMGLSAKARARLCRSFTASTLVLMANGDQKPIEQVEVGDEVLATDPQTGVTDAKVVTAVVMTPDDEDFTDLSIREGQASTSSESAQDATLTTTWHHPFWSLAAERWTEASSLRVGEELRQPDGKSVTATGVRSYHQKALTYNLTVADFHTYYVMAGNAPVLVHNVGECPVDGVPHGAIGEAASLDRLQKGGYTDITPQVRFINSNGDVFIADFVARNPSGEWVAVESKVGGATVTGHQDVGYPELIKGGAILNTSKLEQYGLKKGSMVKMPLEIDHWQCGVCNP